MTQAKVPDLEPEETVMTKWVIGPGNRWLKMDDEDLDGGTEDVDVHDAQIPDDQDREPTNGESNVNDAEQRRL
jgi:hypothetical protein